MRALGEMESSLIYIQKSGDRYPQCLPISASAGWLSDGIL